MRIAMALLLLAAPTVAAAQFVVALDAEARAGLARQSVDTKVHDTALRCEGVALVDLLRKHGAMPDKPLHGTDLARVVIVEGSDGYRAAFSLGELDPTLGGRKVYLVDRCNDAALDANDGPLRLLVPDDSRAARGVRQVESLYVEDAP